MYNKNSLPLFNALNNHKLLKRSSFHTPGHKNNLKNFYKNLLELDYTELPDTDSLYEPESAILKAEKLTANLFGVEKTAFSAGGCTLCIQSMLKLVSQNRKKIICGRTIHKSAINTMALLGLEPIWIIPHKDAGNFLPGRIQSEDVKKALENNEDISAVYITSPDYFGVISDIKSISKECNKFNVPLIVDNAHGSHLMFLEENLHPIKLGASMTACSGHKTLPILTGGAWLNINDKRFINDVKGAMALFGSTSPSYPIMASLDLCRLWLEKEGKESFEKLRKKVDKIKQLILNKGMQIPSGVCDPVRISFSPLNIGITGIEMAEILRNSGIEPEYTNYAYIVLIATPFNKDEDFKRLEKAIVNLKKGQPLAVREYTSFLPKSKLSPRNAILSRSKTVRIKDALGQVAAETLCPCPPGIPIIMPGEIIDRKCIELLLNYSYSFIKVVL